MGLAVCKGVVDIDNAITPVNWVNVIFYFFQILRLFLVKFFPQIYVENTIATALGVLFAFYNLLELVQKYITSVWCVSLEKYNNLKLKKNLKIYTYSTVTSEIIAKIFCFWSFLKNVILCELFVFDIKL